MRKCYHDISQKWDRCESLLKRAETLRGEVCVPAINELRYAGRRIADAFAILGREDAREEELEAARACFDKASLFCTQAEHDCVDAIVLYAHSLIKEFRSEYDHDMLADHCPGLDQYMDVKREIDEFLVQSREFRRERDDIYQKIINEHIDKMIDICRSLEKAERHLKTEYSKRLKKYRDMERKADLSLWAGVIGVVFGVVTYFVK